ALPRSARAGEPAGRVDLAELRAYLRRALAAKHDAIMASARPSGQFGTLPWIVRDQDVMLTLALLYRDEAGPHHRDPEVLEAVAAAGRYLRSRQDAKGMWPFDKKDGSNWGQIYMPWTYLRWMITYDLIAADLAPADRAIWAEGLQLGYGGIAATELSSRSNIYPGPLTGHPPLKPGEVIPWIHNIPCHHAAGLFIAGRAFRRPEWQQQAREYIRLVVAAQSEHGWWTEHSGPVVLYNRVYLEALGVYFALTGDDGVLPALERGNRYHLNYTYPDGAAIETVDERNPYEPVKLVRGAHGERTYLPAHVAIHPGLYFTDEGRALLGHQLPLVMARDAAELDAAEFLYLFLPPGATELTYRSAPAARFRMGAEALVAREDPWLVSLSAYCCPRTGNRFIQDRQNLLSVYHRDAGLILGGGNTKLQPLWSTFTVGDTGLLTPIGAKRDTNLAPEVPLAYTPDRCTLGEPGPGRWTLRVVAGGATAELACAIVNDREITLTAQLLEAAPDGRAAAVHLTFLPYPESPVEFSDGTVADLGGARWDKTGVTEVRHQRWRLAVPATARAAGPILPHNPYTADGHAEPKEGRLVVTLPLPKVGVPVSVTLRI
ncbi:MAG TPA: hypothetical protein PLB90_16940, partial [Opitutaceae bacterium]|nr:hypothetical protein [Opitutaceae bacterium]